MKKVIYRNPLFFAFLLPAVVDGVLTLLAQNDNYWKFRVVNEASPAYYFLVVSPAFYLLGAFLWFMLWYWIFKHLKEPLNYVLMFLFISGHSWGGGSWIMRLMRENGLYTLSNQPSIIISWVLLMLYFLVVGLLATFCLEMYLSRRKIL